MSIVQKISSFAPYYKIDKHIILNTDGAYRVCTNGTVESRWVRSGQWGKNWRIGDDKAWHPHTVHINARGYPWVDLRYNRQRKSKLISRLVLEAVVGPCPPGMEACHVYDPNPLNNWSWNLEWNTHANNALHRHIHGTMPDQRGEKSSSAKLTWEQVHALRADWATGCYTQMQLGEKYSLHVSSVNEIVNNKTWVI